MQKHQKFLAEQTRIPTEVTSGLTLKLDAGNTASYNGSGTTWFDISGNGRNATLNGSPTFTSGTGGYFTFNGANQDAAGSATGVSGNSARTMTCWFNMTSGTDKIPFSMGNTSTQNTAFPIVPQSSGWINIYGLLGTFDESNTAWQPLIGLGWHYIAQTWDANNPGTITTYANGYKVSSYTRTAGKAYNTDAGYRVANWGNNDRYFTGRVAQCCVYNRVLTDAEIEQNWLATKDRFGL